jgi:imidazolonepropionase-like amidohydrolase
MRSGCSGHALDCGLTTVRDIGGGDYSLAKAIADGLVRAPRFLYAGKVLSMTGEHGDFRPPEQKSHHHHEIGSMPAGQSVLEVSAGLGALKEDWKRVAEFFGAAEAQAAQTGLCRDPADEAFLAPLVARAQSALGAAPFSAAAAAGRALTYDAAVSEVRAWLETASGPDSV